jgi:WD40 repeat protein
MEKYAEEQQQFYFTKEPKSQLLWSLAENKKSKENLISALVPISHRRVAVSFGPEKRLHLIDLKKQESNLQYFDGDDKGISCILSLPDGRIATGTQGTPKNQAWAGKIGRLFDPEHDGAIRIWDVHKRECQLVLKGHQTPAGVKFIATLQDKERLVSSDGLTISCWDLTTGKHIKEVSTGIDPKDKYAFLFSMSILPSGDILAGNSERGYTIYSQSDFSQSKANIDLVKVYGIKSVFNFHDQAIIHSHKDIWLWHPKEGKTTNLYTCSPDRDITSTFLLRANILAIGHSDGNIELYRLAKNNNFCIADSIGQLNYPNVADCKAMNVAEASDNRMISWSQEGHIFAWDISDIEERQLADFISKHPIKEFIKQLASKYNCHHINDVRNQLLLHNAVNQLLELKKYNEDSEKFWETQNMFVDQYLANAQSYTEVIKKKSLHEAGKYHRRYYNQQGKEKWAEFKKEKQVVSVIKGFWSDIFLSMRVKILLELLIQLKTDCISSATFPEGIKEPDFEKFKEKLIWLTEQELSADILMHKFQMQADVCWSDVKNKQKNLAAAKNTLLSEILKLEEGEDLLYHSGYAGHAVYLQFIRRNNSILIILHNFGSGYFARHQKNNQKEKEKIQALPSAKPYMVGCYNVELFKKPAIFSDYLESIVTAQYEKDAEKALDKIYNKNDVANIETQSDKKMAEEFSKNLLYFKPQKAPNCILRNRRATLKTRALFIDKDNCEALHDYICGYEEKTLALACKDRPAMAMECLPPINNEHSFSRINNSYFFHNHARNIKLSGGLFLVGCLLKLTGESRASNILIVISLSIAIFSLWKTLTGSEQSTISLKNAETGLTENMKAGF